MKKIILLALTAIMLFTVVPNKAVAAEECKHPNSIGAGKIYFWMKTGQGYAHAYSIANGISAGCDVDIEEYCYAELCPTCHAPTVIVHMGKFRDNHEIKSHNTW